MIRYLLLTLVLLVASANAQPPTGGGGTTAPTQFWPLHTFTVGSGSGTITGAGPISCGTICTASYVNGVTTILYALPAPGSTFTGWSGACAGTAPCSVTMISVKNVTATFTPAASTADIFAGPPPAPGGSSGSCTTRETACDVWRAVDVVQCGQVLQLNNGIYSSTRYMFDLVAAGLTGKTCSVGNEIVIRAETDGGVTIDGGGALNVYTFWFYGLDSWIFEGFNVTNSDETASIGITAAAPSQINRNLQFKRMCFSNSSYPPIRGNNTVPYQDSQGGPSNRHILAVVSLQDSLFEDICVFGTGRVGINEREQSFGNVYRRVWVRWEGWYNSGGLGGLTDCGGPPIQAAYGTPQNSTFENVITVWNPERVQAIGPSHPCYQLSNVIGNGGYLNRDTPPVGSPGYKWLGWVTYGYSNSYIVAPTIKWWATGGGDDLGNHAQLGTATDLFVDGREWPRTGETADSSSRNIVFFCQQPQGPVVPCPGYFVNRVTSIRSLGRPPVLPGDFNEGSFGLFTNFNECVGTAGVIGPSLGGCPGFYTGDSPGTGARQCFEYFNGTLTSTPKWPWRMDNRIKAALAYEHAAGRGASPLAGVAGPGYEANTVTSEIVSRYGAIPAACLR